MTRWRMPLGALSVVWLSGCALADKRPPADRPPSEVRRPAEPAAPGLACAPVEELVRVAPSTTPRPTLVSRPLEACPAPVEAVRVAAATPADSAWPAVLPTAAVAVGGETPAADAPGAAAVRAWLDGRREEANELLARCPAADREVLRCLLPVIGLAGQGGLADAGTGETTEAVGQLERAAGLLRPRADLRVDRLCFCRRIQRYGLYEPLPADRAFRPGELVEVYCEVRNFSSEPAGRASGGAEGYVVRLGSSLEVRDAAGHTAWRHDFDTAESSRSPRHDYFHNYGFRLPDLPPGSYRLSVRVTDRATGRAAQHWLDFRVAAAGE